MKTTYKLAAPITSTLRSRPARGGSTLPSSTCPGLVPPQRPGPCLVPKRPSPQQLPGPCLPPPLLASSPPPIPSRRVPAVSLRPEYKNTKRKMPATSEPKQVEPYQQMRICHEHDCPEAMPSFSLCTHLQMEAMPSFCPKFMQYFSVCLYIYASISARA